MTTSGSSSSSSSSRLCCRLILLGLIIVWVFIQECSELIPWMIFSFELGLVTCDSHVRNLECTELINKTHSFLAFPFSSNERLSLDIILFIFCGAAGH